jgi:glycine amidinotransferase
MSDMIESTKSAAVPQHDSSQFTIWLHKNLSEKLRLAVNLLQTVRRRKLKEHVESPAHSRASCADVWPAPTFFSLLLQHIVNSWNEWDQLEEIIVGTASLAVIPPVEPAFEMKVKDSGKLEMLSAANGIFRTFLIFACFLYCKY